MQSEVTIYFFGYAQLGRTTTSGYPHVLVCYLIFYDDTPQTQHVDLPNTNEYMEEVVLYDG
jgi:hypothetical protein